jgi:hypothetical protein
MASLLAHVSAPLHWLAVALWALGGVLYLLIAALLVLRLRRFGLRPDELSPDWWIVMGAPAIFSLSAGTLVGHAGLGSPIGVLGLVSWSVAGALIPVLAVAGGVASADVAWVVHASALDDGVPARDVQRMWSAGRQGVRPPVDARNRQGLRFEREIPEVKGPVVVRGVSGRRLTGGSNDLE